MITFRTCHGRRGSALGWVTFGALVATGFAAALAASAPSQATIASSGQSADHILFIPLPPDVPSAALANADAGLRDRLHRLALQHPAVRRPLPSGTKDVDRVIVFIDHDGAPILPDLEQARRARRSAAAPAEAVTDLTFTFNSPSHPWSDAELAALNTSLRDFYPTAKTIYGDPAFTITVNVRKEPSITAAGLYYPGFNEIVLPNLATFDPLCHEMLHAFRDDNLVALNSYEEGMTRAAEIEVFHRLPSYSHWDSHHGYTYDVYYEGLSTPAIGSAGGNFFRGYVATLLRYQLAGYAWAKPLLENPLFLSAFNRELYLRTLTDPSTTDTEWKLLDIGAAVQQTVEGTEFTSWYAKQAVLDTNPPVGTFAYQRLNQNNIDLFERTAAGAEVMLPGVDVEWEVYDYQDHLLAMGSAVTNARGVAGFEPSLPPAYAGRLRTLVLVFTAQGVVSSTSYRPAANNIGVFGVVTSSDRGTVLLTPLDDPGAPVSAEVVQGAFFVPGLASVRGRILATYIDLEGASFSRQFTKDASSYFLTLSTPISITASDPSASEVGPDPGKFTVRRVGKGTQPLTVKYVTGGTATGGVDYVQVLSKVTIPAGAESAAIAIVPIHDTIVEGTETVQAALAAGDGYAIGTPNTATIAIADDEPLPVVTVAATVPTAIEAGLRPGVFRVSRTGSAGSSLVVVYTLSGTAHPLLDVMPFPGFVRIFPGSAYADVMVTPLADAVSEPDETLILTIRPLIGTYTVGVPGAATVTITEGPDLIVSSLAAPPRRRRGHQIVVAVTTANQGTSMAAATVTRLWLSEDAVLDAGDLLLETVDVPSLPAGSSHVAEATATVPRGTPLSKRFLIATADASSVQAESNESNNSLSVSARRPTP